MAARMKMRMIRANAIADTVGIVISMPMLPPASIEKIRRKKRLWCEGAS